MMSILSNPTVYFLFSLLLAFLSPLLITPTLILLTHLITQESDELDEKEPPHSPHYEILFGSPTFDQQLVSEISKIEEEEGGLISDDDSGFLAIESMRREEEWRSTLACLFEEEEHDAGGSDGSVGGVEGIDVADEQVDNGQLCCFGRPGFLKISKAIKAIGIGPKAKASRISPGQAPVYLNVYDLKPAMNGYLYWAGLGVFHSGVEVHGVEYGFEGHDFPTSGVYEVEPHQCPGFKFRRSIFIGTTSLDPTQVREFMERHGASSYNGDSYHLIAKNCNHFSKDVCRMLTGRNIPKWVNRLAKIGSTCSCILPETLKPMTIEKDRNVVRHERHLSRSSPFLRSPLNQSSRRNNRCRRGDIYSAVSDHPSVRC